MKLGVREAGDQFQIFNFFRHLVISDFCSRPTDAAQRTALAKLMGHNVERQDTYIRKIDKDYFKK